MAKHEYIMCSVCVCACTDMSSASNEICITCTSILYGLWIPSAMPRRRHRRRRTPCRMRAAVCFNCLLCDSLLPLSLSFAYPHCLCLVISLFDNAWAILISKSSNSCRLSLLLRFSFRQLTVKRNSGLSYELQLPRLNPIDMSSSQIPIAHVYCVDIAESEQGGGERGEAMSPCRLAKLS